MADEDPTDDTPQLSDTDSSEDDSVDEPIETLVAGRERRKTAGNRYDRDMVLEQAAGDVEDVDEVTLLFADNEEEEDEEFKSGEDDEDGEMSSSDDDDQGPNAAADDLEGEKDIQKQAKDERARKRKADLALTSMSGMRKKLKTDPTRPSAPSTQSKPTKRKERVTWVHDKESGLSSLRKQTIAHRAETIARLKESEAQSKKMRALKEQRDRERARDAPKELTQADRLAEAARIERQNAKSLNRWEATERKRQAEQAAKLAALKDRKLDGPVVSWWSAKAKWIGPKLNKIGNKDAGDVLEGGTEPKKRGRKSKAFLEQQALLLQQQEQRLQQLAGSNPDPEPVASTPSVPEGTQTHTEASTPAPAPAPAAVAVAVPGSVETSTSTPIESNERPRDETRLDAAPTAIVPEAQMPSTAPPGPDDTSMKDIHESAEQGDDLITEAAPALNDSNVAEECGLKRPLDAEEPRPSPPEKQQQPPPPPHQEPQQAEEQTPLPPPSLDTLPKDGPVDTGPKESTAEEPNPKEFTPQDAHRVAEADPVIKEEPVPPESSHIPTIVEPSSSAIALAPADAAASTTTPTAPAEPSPPPPVIEYSTRNLVTLCDFPTSTSAAGTAFPPSAQQDYALFFNTRKMAKPVKHVPQRCPVTTLPARYRDPATGVGFATADAYKKIQELARHKYAWSAMLGCYVGLDGGVVARGVPEGFAG